MYMHKKMLKNIQLHIDGNKKYRNSLNGHWKNGIVTQLNTVQVKTIALEKYIS